MLEIPLDKELTANCLVETGTKLEELILAAMVDYSLNRVQLPLWLQQSLIKWFRMVWFTLGHSGQRTYVKCAEAAWNNKGGGVVHLKSPAFFFFLSKIVMGKKIVDASDLNSDVEDLILVVDSVAQHSVLVTGWLGRGALDYNTTGSFIALKMIAKFSKIVEKSRQKRNRCSQNIKFM